MAGCFAFPTRLFSPTSLRLRPLGQAIGGGASLAGEESFGDVSGGGRWFADFGESALWTPDKVMAWRAFEAFADGGATPIIVPLADRLNQPVTPEYTGAATFGLTTYVDDITDWSADEVTATVSTAAALRATTLSFTYTNSSPNKVLKPGMPFSILHAAWSWRLYRIVRVLAGGLGTGDATTVQFRTPLREAVAEGDALNFDSPRFLARVDGDVSATVEAFKFGSAQAKFIEYGKP